MCTDNVAFLLSNGKYSSERAINFNSNDQFTRFGLVSEPATLYNIPAINNIT